MAKKYITPQTIGLTDKSDSAFAILCAAGYPCVDAYTHIYKSATDNRASLAVLASRRAKVLTDAIKKATALLGNKGGC